MSAKISPLIAATPAAEAIGKGRACIGRWSESHPDLGVTIGHRLYLWRAAVAAIATGTSLADAAEIGRQERERYSADTRARIVGGSASGSASVDAAAA